MKANKKIIGVALYEYEIKQLKDAARSLDITVSALIRQTLREFGRIRLINTSDEIVSNKE